MRIGQVNQENYKDYLKLLGVKNPKSLDNAFGKGKEDWADKDYSFEARAARLVSMGWGTEGMIVDGDTDDGSWKKIVDVPDSFKQQAVKYARDMVIMAAKTGGVSAEQHDKYTLDNKDWSYMMSRPPEERLSISWTFEKIYQAEAQRITDYLRSQIPGWQPGQAFDTRILTETNFGLGKEHFDVRA